jgi:hypothetical protein
MSIIETEYVAESPTSDMFIEFSPEIVGVRYIYVKNLEMTVAWYPIGTYNNNLDFRIGITDYTATIAPGNYSIGDMMTAIRNAMNAVYIPGGFTCSFDFKTYLFTITNSIIAFSLRLMSGPTWNTSIGRYLGFESLNYPPTLTVTGTYLVNIAGDDVVYLTSSDLTLDFINPVRLSSGTTTNIFHRIPVNALFGNLMSFDYSSAPTIIKIRKKTLSTLTLQLYDKTLVRQPSVNGKSWLIRIVIGHQLLN